MRIPLPMATRCCAGPIARFTHDRWRRFRAQATASCRSGRSCLSSEAPPGMKRGAGTGSRLPNMRLAHLSDLHMGAEDRAVVAGLLTDLAAQDVDRLLISGDLTMRARAG